MKEEPGLDDIFSQFFTFGFDFGPRKRTKGQDSVIPCEVTLEDLYNGRTLKMNMEKEVVCSTCKGSGARGNAKTKECSKCEGKGWIYTQNAISSTQFGVSQATCPDCKGKGERLKEKDRCKKCKGEKTVKEKERHEIFIERGMADRQRIVLPGAGDQEPGLPAGDVVFVLRAKKHDAFERSGNDLFTSVTITLSEALLGFSRILITHLDGRGVKVTSPSGRIVRPGDTIILRGEGMPLHKRADSKGDLYVSFKIEMPDEQWLKTADTKAVEQFLPPKKTDMTPPPDIVDEVAYEQCDFADAQARSFPPGRGFFDHSSQYDDDGDDDWVDEDEEDEYHPMNHDFGSQPPECRPQ